ncbi:hypothetical protein SCOR_00450 [Sulfidibacter corallicola]|uniref:Uncharacterized protein n=1 Tax=Sulfidibacter corallicola TaxID=2818388 RepID=A0A8A4TH95_SULCO|nr:hypothetical protein [Sulfidibacter corallicola]QTD49003.1 hypothetical protein J3U87_25745 [Sulfidibacter corallicola]
MIPTKMILDLLDLLQRGDISFAQAFEAIEQKLAFERYRTLLEARFKGLYVFIAKGRVFVGDDFNAMSKRVTAALNGAVYYCEKIE